jgi:hypothetical protein
MICTSEMMRKKLGAMQSFVITLCVILSISIITLQVEGTNAQATMEMLFPRFIKANNNLAMCYIQDNIYCIQALYLVNVCISPTHIVWYILRDDVYVTHGPIEQ